MIKGLLENYPIMVEAKRKIDRVGFPISSYKFELMKFDHHNHERL